MRRRPRFFEPQLIRKVMVSRAGNMVSVEFELITGEKFTADLVPAAILSMT